jgi:hypothetical protein
MRNAALKPAAHFARPLSPAQIETTLRAQSRRSDLTKCVLERFGLPHTSVR